MPRRNLDRERWETYIMMIVLATRPFLLVGALILFLYSMAAFSAYPLIGVISLGLAIFLLLVVFYDQAALWFARVGAWLATFGKNDRA